MNHYIAWVDRRIAKIFLISAEKMERSQIEIPMSDPETGAREKQFYKAVAEKIQDGNNLLLLGPGVAKHHLLNYLSEQYPALAKKVVGCLVSDQPSDQQIAFCASRILNQPFPDIK